MVTRDDLEREGYERVRDFLDLEIWETEEKVKLFDPEMGAEVYTYEK